VGAAALVPFAALRRFVSKGKTSREIAQHFNVSRELVEYRMKVSRLWAEYKMRHPEEIRLREQWAGNGRQKFRTYPN
jgi:Zn-dependent peptidase ImmA (M78 family)